MCGDQSRMLPYLEPELPFENGLLKIYYPFTRSHQLCTVEFNNNKMSILKPQSYGVHSASANFENDKYIFKKGEIISESGNISQVKVETKIIKFDIKPKSLSEYREMSNRK